MRLLVVEDEDSIADPLVDGLRREGYEVERVATGGDALGRNGFDVVLLDLRLPDIDGLDVCRRLRAESDVPIIILSARGDEIDRVLGLEIGADDYVVKPFGFREVLARIRAVARRTQTRPGDETGTFEVGPLRVDQRSHRVLLGADELELTPKEFDLLALLAADPGVAISRQRIIEAVWKTSWYGSTKTIDVHVASLRRKLGDPGWVETVRGVGFRLQAPA